MKAATGFTPFCVQYDNGDERWDLRYEGDRGGYCSTKSEEEAVRESWIIHKSHQSNEEYWRHRNAVCGCVGTGEDMSCASVEPMTDPTHPATHAHNPPTVEERVLGAWREAEMTGVGVVLGDNGESRFVLTLPKEEVDEVTASRAREQALRAEVERLIRQRDEVLASEREAALAFSSPLTADFLDAVRTEAAHQVHRFGSGHDAGKDHSDWFWLLGWLAGKAVRAAEAGDVEKARHHTISSAAMLMNWHAHLSGARSQFRPGIDALAREDGGE